MSSPAKSATAKRPRIRVVGHRPTPSLLAAIKDVEEGRVKEYAPGEMMREVEEALQKRSAK